MPSKKQQQVISLLKNFSPKEFGVENVFYKVNKDNIEVIFVVNKSNAQSSISYLNALASIIENEVKGVRIESNVYVQEKGKSRIEHVAVRERFNELSLVNLSLAGA